jgi:hypothetical protein
MAKLTTERSLSSVIGSVIVPNRGWDWPMAELSDELRRALNLLAARSDGCGEPALLADGVTISQLAGLVVDGFATGSVARRALGGPVIWMKITEKGRMAITD